MVWTNEGAFYPGNCVKILICRKCFISFYRCVCVLGEGGGGGGAAHTMVLGMCCGVSSIKDKAQEKHVK